MAAMDCPNGEPRSSLAGASAAEQAHPGHVGADRRQFDAIVDLLRGLRSFREYRAAGWAGGQLPVDLPVGVRMQRPAYAGAALAGWTICLGG